MTDLDRIASGGDAEIIEMAENDFNGQPVSPADYREMGGTDEQYIEDMMASLPCWRELDAEQFAVWRNRVAQLVEEN